MDLLAFARLGLGAVELLRQGLVEHLVDEGGLARTRDPSDASEGAQGDLHVHLFEVVLGRALDLEELAAPLAPGRGHLDFLDPAEVLPGDGVRAALDVLQRALGHHLSPVDTRPGADVHNVVGGADGVLVVLHHDEGVADVPQVAQGGDELVVVPLVQPDAGLVQDVEDPHQGGADLGGQADALALPP